MYANFCENKTKFYQSFHTYFTVAHFLFCFVTLQREIQNSNISTYGQVMKMAEVVSIFFYLGMIIMSLNETF